MKKILPFWISIFLFFSHTILHAQIQFASLLWATYYGHDSTFTSSHIDGITTDASGNVYITGTTSNDSGIATPGAYQDTFGGGGIDVFLAKFSSAGTLLWATYFGGQGQDYVMGISTDIAGNVFIAGQTTSFTGLATKGAYMTSFYSDFGKNTEGFLAKFNSSGDLLWATYYGDSVYVKFEITLPTALVADISGNIYLSGQTLASSGIATSGSYQTAIGINDGFLAKFDTSGSLLWATYYGGAGGSASTDKSGNVYIAGYTYNDSNIATSGAYQTTFTGKNGDINGFLAKFSPSGNLSWGTYFGGVNGSAYGVKADKSGDVYITGFTGSKSSVATSGTYQTSLSGGYDAFLAKFDTSGSLIWGTYYGNNIEGESIVIDKSRNVYISGNANSQSGIAITLGAYQTLYGNGYNSYLAKFSVTGSLVYSSFYGGPGQNYNGNYVTSDAFGNVYLTGYSDSNGIATRGAYQDSVLKNGEPFLIKFSIKTFNNDAGISSIVNPKDSFCGNLLPVTVRLTNYGLNTLTSVTVNLEINSKLQTPYNWTGSIMTDSSMSANIGNYYLPSGIDSIVVFTSQPNGFADSILYNDTSKSIDTVITGPSTIIGSNTSVCYGDTASIGGISVSGTTYSWASKPKGYSSSKSTGKVAPTVTTTYILTQTLTSTGCSRNDTEIVMVNPLPDAFFSHKLMADSVKFSPVYSTYSNYYWTFGDGDTSSQINPTHAYLKNGIYTVRLTATDKNGCTSSYQTNDTVNYTGIKIPTANSAINIYPNPATSTLNIESTTNPIQFITVFDITGKEVYSLENLNTLNQSIPVANLPSGIYLIKAGFDNGSYMTKFMK